MDPTAIVGYLVAKLLGSAQRFAGQQVDKLLDRLANRVWQRLGGDRALVQLSRDPRNEVAQEWARTSIDHAGHADPAFARLQQQLEQRAPDLLVYAPGTGTVVGVNSGDLIQEPVTFNQTTDPADCARATIWWSPRSLADRIEAAQT